MANQERGEVDFVVGDKSYTLALTMNAICEMQTRTKKTYGQLIHDMAMMDFVALRDLLWMTLKRHHAREFDKPEKVGELIDRIGIGGPARAMDVITDLFKSNRRRQDEEAPADGEGPQRAQD